MFKNPFSFKGRVTRTQHAISRVVFLLPFLILTLIINETKDTQSMKFYILGFLWFMWLFIGGLFSIAQSVKRAHDLGHSGWYVLFLFLPVLMLYDFWLLFGKPQLGTNRFGEDPRCVKNKSKITLAQPIKTQIIEQPTIQKQNKKYSKADYSKIIKICLGVLIGIGLLFLGINYKDKLFGRKNKTDLAQENIKGAVKSIEENEYTTVAKFGKVEKGELISKKITTYNKDGNIIEEVRYNEKGELTEKNIHTYDKKGKKLKISAYDGNGTLFYFITYEYDDQGRLSFLNKDRIEIASYGLKYSYDEKGNISEEEHYIAGEPIGRKTINHYDENNRLVEATTYEEENKLFDKISYKYDDKDNIIEELYNGLENSDGYASNTEYIEYDSKGNWTKKIASGIIEEMFVEREIEYYGFFDKDLQTESYKDEKETVTVTQEEQKDTNKKSIQVDYIPSYQVPQDWQGYIYSRFWFYDENNKESDSDIFITDGSEAYMYINGQLEKFVIKDNDFQYNFPNVNANISNENYQIELNTYDVKECIDCNRSRGKIRVRSISGNQTTEIEIYGFHG